MSIALHRCRSGLLLLVAMALLAGQIGAQAHAYSHAGVPAAPTDPLHSHHDLCQECLAFTPLLAGAGGFDHAVQLPDVDAHAFANGAGASISQLRPVLAFRSRAPPKFL